MGFSRSTGYFREALASFEANTIIEPGGALAFAATSWQGHVHDLLGNRERALAGYRKALTLYTRATMQHRQYNMVIDQEWIETRLQTAFTWAK